MAKGIKQMKQIRVFSRLIYPLSEEKLIAEIIAQGEAGFTVRITPEKGKGRLIPFDGCVILNCLYGD